jgi:hypothetical protein
MYVQYIFVQWYLIGYAEEAWPTMTECKPMFRDPLEIEIEAALRPGCFIGYRETLGFISRLDQIAEQIGERTRADPWRAVHLHESFLAGCYEKAEELDDSDGDFGMFASRLCCHWIEARQAAHADPDETAGLLFDRMATDPYGFLNDVSGDAVKVMNKHGLAAFERAVQSRFDKQGESKQKYNRWGQVLRDIYVQKNDVSAYVALCERTEFSPSDGLALAEMLHKQRKVSEALAWVERGLALDKKQPYPSVGEHPLARLRRELFCQLGRESEALDEAWREFQEWPCKHRYEELMRFVPETERASWYAKALDAVEHADLGPAIKLLLETNETKRLVRRVQIATDSALEGLSHYTTEPAAKRLAQSHPGVAAKVFRAMAMRILNAAKSKYYDAALSNLEEAKSCYERAGMESHWKTLVAKIRHVHHRKRSFISGFEHLVTGRGPSKAPSFLARARGRWLPRGS